MSENTKKTFNRDNLDPFVKELIENLSDMMNDGDYIGNELYRIIDKALEGRQQKIDEIKCLLIDYQDFFFNAGFWQGVSWTKSGYIE